MSGVAVVTVDAKDDGMRVDRWFKQHYPQLGHGALQRMLRKGQVRIDGARAEASNRLATGQTVRVPPMPDGPPASEARTGAQRTTPRDEAAQFLRPLILWEDDDLLALNKPFGLAVQGGAGQTRHIDGMLHGLVREGEEVPRLVHRLDRDTGGVLLLAKSRTAAARLSKAFKTTAVDKVYWALVRRVPSPLQGRIDLPIGKTGAAGGVQKVRPGADGKTALTDYQVLDMAGQKAAFLALKPLTGRTHQLRVHLASIGTPIVGDGKYGGKEAFLEGVASKMHLFCSMMRVPTMSGKPVTITAPLTGHMAETVGFFGLDTPDPQSLEWPE